jgi:hypothetical protein
MSASVLCFHKITLALSNFEMPISDYGVHHPQTFWVVFPAQLTTAGIVIPNSFRDLYIGPCMDADPPAKTT